MNTFDAWNEMEKERKQRKENASCSEWISVKEKLPDDRHSVLVYCPYNKCIFTAYYDDFAGEWVHFGGCMPGEVYYPVTHWMPLPEPPEEGVIADGN